MKTNLHLLVPILVALLAAAAYGIAQYPEHRVLTWVEFFTDGHVPDFLAEDARMVLARIWRRVFRENHMAPVAQGLAHHIKDRFARADVLELAAGSGVAAALWNQELTRRHGIAVRTVITDLQPTPNAWERIVREYDAELGKDSSSSLSFLNEPLDATDVSKVISKHYNDWGQSTKTSVVEIRMVHLALHHFTPHLVKDIFCDAIKSNAMIVVGDLLPSVENVLLTGLQGWMEMHWLIWPVLKSEPWKAALLLFYPIWFWIVLHDGTVSVLRSYSVEQLTGLLQQCPRSDRYQVETYQVYPFADLFGTPGWLPSSNKKHIQFFIASPVGGVNRGKCFSQLCRDG